MMLLRLSNITKSFGFVRALKSVSFSLNTGEVHALLGENGAGKSTLIKIITGAHRPDSGTIEIQGTAIDHLSPASARTAGIAAIYQQPALFPDLSVSENIALGLEKPAPFRRVRWNDRRSRAQDLLHSIGANIDPDAEIRSLSMPEQQLVEIAKAIGAGTRILIMDEPTASLTQKEVHLLFAVIRDLKARGVGVIYISHRLEEIFQIADRVTVLRDGETIGTQTIRETNEPTLIRMMIGREVSPPAEVGTSRCDVHRDPASDACKRTSRRDVPTSAYATLAVRNLACSDSGIHNITFDLRAGEIFGFAGLLGAGRTELARVLFGITPATAGTILINAKPVHIRSPREAVQYGIAYVPEDRRRHGLILEMPLSANITMALHPLLFPGTWLRFASERQLALDYIRQLDIKTSGPENRAANLSGGNQQKTALARWLATKPKILIFDEPTQGVDVAAKAEIHRLVRHLADNGLAVLLISSDLPEVLALSDRIAVMRDKTIVNIFDATGATAHSVMSAALGQPV